MSTMSREEMLQLINQIDAENQEKESNILVTEDLKLAAERLGKKAQSAFFDPDDICDDLRNGL